MKYRLLFILLTFLVYSFVLNPGDDDRRFYKTLDDDATKSTNVGNIGITVTNFGTYGHGFVLWPEQPSCEYPLGSGIEHLFDGGLWVGCFIAEDSLGSGKVGPFVTTGAVDAASVAARGGGFEYTNAPGDEVEERSSLFDSRFFDPSAISHQDFVMDFVDTNTVFDNGEPILNHDPIGLSIHLETYAWDFPFANFFVIFKELLGGLPAVHFILKAGMDIAIHFYWLMNLMRPEIWDSQTAMLEYSFADQHLICHHLIRLDY
jgi:hypothetical protein